MEEASVKESSSTKGLKPKHTLSVSPPSAAESLFLGLAAPHPSVMGDASTMFEKLKHSPGPQRQQQVQFVGRIVRNSGSFHSRASNSNVSIDDFASCVENHSDLDSFDSAENENIENNYVSPIAAARNPLFSMETIDDDNDNTSNYDTDNDSDNDTMYINKWEAVEGALIHVSVSADGKHIWGTARDNTIWHRAGAGGKWQKIGGALTQVSVSADGNHVWGVNKSCQIFHRPGVGGSWRKIDGGLKYVTVSRDGKHVWGVNNADMIYHRAGVGGKWQKN